MISLNIADDFTGETTNFAEISAAEGGQDCDSTPDSNPNNDGTPVNDDIGTGCDEGGDEDDHDPETIIVDATPLFDLALQKTLSASTPGAFEPGDTVTFDIEVFNQGNVDATNVVVTDYVPTGLTLANGSSATMTIPSILSGESEIVSISFTINAGVTGSIVNYAEISAAEGGQDCDSTPDATNGNTSGEEDENLVNDEIGGQCDDMNVGDEDDHDLEEIMIGVYDLALVKEYIGTETLTV